MSPILFSSLIAAFGWRVSFLWAALATAALALLWLGYVRNTPAEHPRLANQTAGTLPGDLAGRAVGRSFADWVALARSPNLLILTFSYFCVCYFEYIFFFWLYYYLGEIRGLESQETAVATTVVFLSWMVMSPVGGWASDRLVTRYGRKAGRRVIPVACLLLSGITLCIGINVGNTVAGVALLAFYFGLAACSDGSYWAAAIDIGRRDSGSACGILNAGGNVGGVAPVVTPWIAARSSWSMGLYFAVLVLYVGVFAWFLVDPTKHSRRRAPTPSEDFSAASAR